MLYSFFIFGELPWLIILAIESLILICALAQDDFDYYSYGGWKKNDRNPGTISSIALCVFLGLWILFGNAIETFKQYEITFSDIAYFFLAYFVIGSVWAIFKWLNKCQKRLNLYNDFKSGWLEDNDLKSIQDNIEEFTQDARNRFPNWVVNKELRLSPNPSEYKGNISYWIGYWPWSVLSFFLFDLIKEITSFIGRKLIGLMNRISGFVFRNVNKELQ